MAYTDGSATAGTEDGGGGAVVWENRQETRIRKPAGQLTVKLLSEADRSQRRLKFIETKATDQQSAKTIRI